MALSDHENSILNTLHHHVEEVHPYHFRNDKTALQPVYKSTKLLNIEYWLFLVSQFLKTASTLQSSHA